VLATMSSDIEAGHGFTLVHLSAHRKRFLWDKGYLGGVQGVSLAGRSGCFGVQGMF
jgi:hypothetical protein